MSDLDDETRFVLVSQAVLGRKPTSRELEVSIAFIQQDDSEESRRQNWAQAIQAVFASVDFRYIN